MNDSEISQDPLIIAEKWMDEGRSIAVATVVETWGSAPRPVGSHLIIDADGNFEGSVSGGCVEGEVISEAMDVLSEGKPKTLRFGVADETAWRVGLSCGGRISVYVEKVSQIVDRTVLSELNSERKARRAVILLTGLDGGEDRLVRENDALEGALGEAVLKAFGSGKSGIVEADGKKYFLNVHLPPPRIVVIGAVHISQALAPMAAMAGFDMRIIDPRTAFATPERFADVELDAEWPDEVLSRHPLDAYTALVAVTHDPKIDDMPLQVALEAGCFYVGALGSRKTHAGRVERLRSNGVGDDAISRISAPIGLDIGAASPAEIAVAILAEIIRALRKRKAIEA